MAYRYLPMLKTKAGEVEALQNLSVAARSKILPIFNVCESVAARYPAQLASAWSGPAALDGSFSFKHTGNANVFTSLLATLRASGVQVIPSFGPSDPTGYQQVARQAVNTLGAVARVGLGQVGQASSWAAAQGLQPSAVDLVVDARHIAGVDVPSYAGYITNLIGQNGASLAAFRSIALAGAAAPKDHGSLNYGVNRVPRNEWLVWSAVRTNVPFRLDYGDYLTGHPDLTEPPGAAMATATVSARYTLDNEWLIIKGRRTTGPNGIPMATQYSNHATVITSDPGFGGVPGTWADGQIALAAAGAPRMGSRQKWSGFSANRHISLVADRLP